MAGTDEDLEVARLGAELVRLRAQNRMWEARFHARSQELLANSAELARQQRIMELASRLVNKHEQLGLAPELLQKMLETAGEAAARRQAEQLAELSTDDAIQEVRRQLNAHSNAARRHKA